MAVFQAQHKPFPVPRTRREGARSMRNANWPLVPVMAPGPFFLSYCRLATACCTPIVRPVWRSPLHVLGRVDVGRRSRRGRVVRSSQGAGRRYPSRASTLLLPSSRTWALLIRVQHNPSPPTVIAVLLHKLFLLIQSLDCDNRANRWMPVVAWYRCRDNERWAFLLTLLMAPTSV